MGQKEELRLLNLKGHAPQLGASLAGTTDGWILAWQASTSSVVAVEPGGGATPPSAAIAAISDQADLTPFALDSSGSTGTSITRLWHVYGPSSSTDIASSTLSSTTATSPTFTPPTDGEFTVTLTVTDSGALTDSTSRTFRVGDPWAWHRLVPDGDGVTAYNDGNVSGISDAADGTTFTYTGGLAECFDATTSNGAQYYIPLVDQYGNAVVTNEDRIYILDTYLKVVTDPGVNSGLAAAIVLAANPGSTSIDWAGAGYIWTSGVAAYRATVRHGGRSSRADVTAQVTYALLTEHRQARSSGGAASPRFEFEHWSTYDLSGGNALLANNATRNTNTAVLGAGTALYAVAMIGSNKVGTAATAKVAFRYRAFLVTNGHAL